MALWAKNVAVFGKRKLGRFLAGFEVLTPKVAVSDLKLLETLAGPLPHATHERKYLWLLAWAYGPGRKD